MVKALQVKRAENPQAVKEREPWLIIGSPDQKEFQIIESHFSLERARKGMFALIEHDQKNDHIHFYQVRHITDVECID